MKTLLLTATILGSLAGTAIAKTPVWYVAHLGPDSCVPLADVGEDFQRIYYGGGTMRTPDDYVQSMHGLGITMTQAPTEIDGMILYHAQSNASKTDLLLFNNRDLCTSVMSYLER